MIGSFTGPTIVCDLELAISSSTLGMDNTLWDSFAVKVCKQINQVEVLK